MLNKELFDKYNALLNEQSDIKQELQLLLDGYISEKTISGKKYYYLQKKLDGKIKSEYIKENDVESVRRQLERRAVLTARFCEINENAAKIEAAAKILSTLFYHKLIVLKRCYIMDNMPIKNRESSLSFASAMTALEGIPASDETNKHLALWSEGKQSFKSGYMQTLAQYNLIEV